MITREDFMSRIIESPDDDAPRLVFADWLDENGEPERAEFIRVQCEIHRIEENVWCSLEWTDAEWGDREREEKKITDECNNSLCPKCEPLKTLRWCEWELLTKNHYEWMGRPDGIATYRSPGGEYKWLTKHSGENGRQIDIEFHRGFIDVVTCTWSDWLAHSPAILAATPLREVRLTTLPVHRFLDSGRAQFAGSPHSHWIPRGENLDHSQRGIIESLLKTEWPRLKFTLPQREATWTYPSGNWRHSNREWEGVSLPT